MKGAMAPPELPMDAIKEKDDTCICLGMRRAKRLAADG